MNLFQLALASLALLQPLAAVASSTVDPYVVMRAIDERPRGGDQTMTTTFRLVRKSGEERVRRLRTYWKDYRGVQGGLFSKRIAVFDSPPDLEGTAFLVFSYLDPALEDDRWAYLPALRKVRRIAGGDRGQSFFGTDLSYEDLAERNAEEDSHKYVRTEQLDGRTHYVIESTPRDPSFPYSKRLLWVDPGSATASRIEYFDRQGREEKVLALEWQHVEGIWAWKRLEMQTLRTRHRTIVEVEEVHHRRGLEDALFSESALQLGVHP